MQLSRCYPARHHWSHPTVDIPHRTYTNHPSVTYKRCLLETSADFYCGLTPRRTTDSNRPTRCGHSERHSLNRSQTNKGIVVELHYLSRVLSSPSSSTRPNPRAFPENGLVVLCPQEKTQLSSEKTVGELVPMVPSSQRVSQNS